MYSLQEAISNQLSASIEMLKNAVEVCPDELWKTENQFWYKAFHCTFWTDYYLSKEPKNFSPPPPFSLSEFETLGTKPPRIYTKLEVLLYINHCQVKASQLIENSTIESLHNRWVNEYKNFSLLEIIMYNIRHIQHHTGQLNLILAQQNQQVPAWIERPEKY